MKNAFSSSICVLFVLSVFVLPETIVHGQRHSDSGKPAFVTNSNGTQNTIYIPNQEKFHQFRIYKKEKKEILYCLVATINSSRSDKTITPYDVIWIDTDPNALTVDYVIEAYNHDESKICNMKVIWQAAKK